jgi:hypothetical protein
VGHDPLHAWRHTSAQANQRPQQEQDICAAHLGRLSLLLTDLHVCGGVAGLTFRSPTSGTPRSDPPWWACMRRLQSLVSQADCKPHEASRCYSSRCCCRSFQGAAWEQHSLLPTLLLLWTLQQQPHTAHAAHGRGVPVDACPQSQPQGCTPHPLMQNSWAPPQLGYRSAVESTSHSSSWIVVAVVELCRLPALPRSCVRK